jgi:predicted cobalt transporter CbtA
VLGTLLAQLVVALLLAICDVVLFFRFEKFRIAECIHSHFGSANEKVARKTDMSLVTFQEL